MAAPRNSFHPADYVVFTLSLAISLSIGVFFAFKGNKNRGDYMTGNRKLSLLPVAISMQVSFTSAILILGTPAEMYTQGTEFFMSSIGRSLGIFLTAVIFVPLLYPLKCTSAFEYLERRFQSKSTRILGSLMIMLNQIVYMGVACFAPSTAFEAVTGFPVWGSIVVSISAATIYTCIGGIKAVVWSDVFQACIMLGGMLAIAIQGGLKVGGLGKVFEINECYGRLNFLTLDPDPTRRHTIWGLVIGYGIQGLAQYSTSQSSVQRMCSLPTQRKAMSAVFINSIGGFIISTLACLMGIELFAYYASKNCDLVGNKIVANPNQVVPFFVMETLAYPTIPGLFMSSLFAGALSSISSSLNSLATLVWEDFVKQHVDSKWNEARKMVFIKATVIIMGCVTMALALVIRNLEGTVMQMAIALMGATGGPLLGMFLLGAIFPWANSKGALFGGVLSLGISMWFTMGSYVVGIPKDKFYTPTGTCDEYRDDALNVTIHGVISTMNTNGSHVVKDLSGLDKMYSVSYLWFSAIGMVTCILIGLLVSFLTGANSLHDVPTKYQIPLARRLLCCLPRSCTTTLDCRRDFDTDQKHIATITKTSTHNNEAFEVDDTTMTSTQKDHQDMQTETVNAKSMITEL